MPPTTKLQIMHILSWPTDYFHFKTVMMLTMKRKHI